MQWVEQKELPMASLSAASKAELMALQRADQKVVVSVDQMASQLAGQRESPMAVHWDDWMAAQKELPTAAQRALSSVVWMACLRVARSVETKAGLTAGHWAVPWGYHSAASRACQTV